MCSKTRNREDKTLKQTAQLGLPVSAWVRMKLFSWSSSRAAKSKKIKRETKNKGPEEKKKQEIDGDKNNKEQ